MRNDLPSGPSVVVYVNGTSCSDPDTDAGGHSCRDFSGGSDIKSAHLRHAVPLAGSAGRRAMRDPHQVRREFPDKWRDYIRANFHNTGHVMQEFGVSDRTARNWWNGETGAVGGHVAMAVEMHPVEAPRMLFAAE